VGAPDVGPIVTARLSLQPFTSAQACDVLSGARRPEWAEGYPTPGDVEVATWVSNPRFGSPDARFGPRTIVVRVPGLCIGGIGFHGVPREDGTVEIGYGIAEEWRGQGLGSEAIAAFVAHAWSLPGVQRVIATTEEDNTASVHALLGAGLVPTPLGGGSLRFLCEAPVG